MPSTTLCSLLAMGVIVYLQIGNVHGAPGSQIVGFYELTSDPGDASYVAYLSALEVSEPFRQVMSRIKINIEIEKQDDWYKYRIVTPLMSRETNFQFGQEISDTYVDGRQYMTIFNAVGNTVVQKLMFANVEGINEYRFSPQGIVATLIAKDKSAVRTYKRVRRPDV